MCDVCEHASLEHERRMCEGALNVRILRVSINIICSVRVYVRYLFSRYSIKSEMEIFHAVQSINKHIGNNTTPSTACCDYCWL